jgi:hypothetical protein
MPLSVRRRALPSVTRIKCPPIDSLNVREAIVNAVAHRDYTSNGIVRTMPGKPNSRLQKYKLTAKGRARLN